jgi:hypothetical protein
MLHLAPSTKKLHMHYYRYVVHRPLRRPKLTQYAPRAASSIGTVLARMNRS